MGLAWGWCGFLEAEGGGSLISFGTQRASLLPKRRQEPQGGCCRAGRLVLRAPGALAGPSLGGRSWRPGVPSHRGGGSVTRRDSALQALPSLTFRQNHS